MTKIPKPRNKPKKPQCSWCHQKFDSVFALGYHINSCPKRQGSCSHPRFSRKKKYIGIVTIGTKKYKTWSVTCKKCGVKLANIIKEKKK